MVCTKKPPHFIASAHSKHAQLQRSLWLCQQCYLHFVPRVLHFSSIHLSTASVNMRGTCLRISTAGRSCGYAYTFKGLACSPDYLSAPSSILRNIKPTHTSTCEPSPVYIHKLVHNENCGYLSLCGAAGVVGQ